MNDDFDGRVALVTGAGSGIGKAIATHFARRGAQVVVADLNERGGAGTVDAIRDAGGVAEFVHTDVASGDSVQHAVGFSVDTFGRLDYGINNAGIGLPGKRTHEWTEDEWDRLIAINLRGVWLSMKFEIGQMLDQGEGWIVNTASVAGLVGVASLTAYVASKHAVVGLTRSAALEYATDNIRINAVCPGYILTEQVEAMIEANPRFGTRLTGLHPIGRLGTTDEVAEAVAWLCSNRSSLVVGHTLVADGGYTAQ